MLTNDIVSFEQPGPGRECYEQTLFSIPISDCFVKQSYQGLYCLHAMKENFSDRTMC